MDEQIVETKPGVVEEFVDNSAGDPTDALAADVISQIETEYADAALEALPDGEAEVVAEETAEPTQEVSTEEATEEGETDRGLERLVAREVALREAETSLKAREAKATELEKENASLKEQLSTVPTNFIDELRFRPMEALEAAGHDPDHVVRLILAAKMQKDGKPVPSELRNAIRDADYDYKLKTQERKLADIEQQRASATFVAKVESDAREYVTKGISKDAPTVVQVAKANPDRVFNEILDEIGRDARSRAQEPGAQLIPFDEAARRVEKRWAEMKSLFGASSEKEASTSAGEKKSTSPAPGASTKQNTAPRGTTPPTKPLIKAKPKTQEELEKEGIDVAMAEYKRVEQAKRAARA